jgi:hypothetical protein
MAAPQFPNTNAPMVDESGVLATTWVIPLSQVFANSNQSGSVTMFAGMIAPVGWTLLTTIGLPALPTGFIWIQKN